MIPYVIILIAALIGGYVHGVVGFFVAGIIGGGGTLIVGLALRKASGGLLPKKVRVQTAKDFLAENAELVSVAWPALSDSERGTEIEGLLEAMFHKAVTESSSFHLDAPAELEHLASSARKVALEQDSEAKQSVAAKLLDFLLVHPLWYGGNT